PSPDVGGPVGGRSPLLRGEEIAPQLTGKGTPASLRILSKVGCGERLIRNLRPPAPYTRTWAHSKQITRATVLPWCVSRRPCRGSKHFAASRPFLLAPSTSAATSFARTALSLTSVCPRTFQPWNCTGAPTPAFSSGSSENRVVFSALSSASRTAAGILFSSWAAPPTGVEGTAQASKDRSSKTRARGMGVLLSRRQGQPPGRVHYRGGAPRLQEAPRGRGSYTRRGKKGHRPKGMRADRVRQREMQTRARGDGR